MALALGRVALALPYLVTVVASCLRSVVSLSSLLEQVRKTATRSLYCIAAREYAMTLTFAAFEQLRQNLISS